MTFAEFYIQEYLPRHSDKRCRLMHVLGLVVSAAYAVVIVWLGIWWLLVLLPMPAYLVAWIGHLIAHNRPTFFEQPVFSFLGYWKMIGAMLTGTI
jgi:hypothetical protein